MSNLKEIRDTGCSGLDGVLAKRSYAVLQNRLEKQKLASSAEDREATDRMRSRPSGAKSTFSSRHPGNSGMDSPTSESKRMGVGAGVGLGADMNRLRLFTRYEAPSKKTTPSTSSGNRRDAPFDSPTRADVDAAQRKRRAVDHGETGHFTGTNHVGRFKTSLSATPEVVVDNESVNSRDYNKLLVDTDEALSLIRSANPEVRDNYFFFPINIDERIQIAYQDDYNITPILDVSIDTVKVHRGWRQVDKKISCEGRAAIVIASLGIPPCPPDIAISNERSKLGRAIREQFNQLKLADAEIYVRRIDR